MSLGIWSQGLNAQEIVEERTVIRQEKQVRINPERSSSVYLSADPLTAYLETGHVLIEGDKSISIVHNFGFSGDNQHFSRVDVFDQNDTVKELVEGNDAIVPYTKIGTYEDDPQIYVPENVLGEPDYAVEVVELNQIEQYKQLGITFYAEENTSRITDIWSYDMIHVWEERIRSKYNE